MASEVVLYTLNTAGNLESQLPKLAEKFDRVRQAAQRATTAAVGGDGGGGGGGGGAGGLSGAFQRLAAAGKSLNQNDMVSQLETVSALFIQVGGNVSRVASLTTSLIRPVAILGTVFGASTLAVGGFAAAVASLPGVYYKLGASLAEAAIGAEERLTKLGKAAEIPPDAIKAAAEYKAANQDLQVAIDRLTVSLGDGFVPAMTQAVEIMASFVDKLNTLELPDWWSDFATGMLALGTGGGSLAKQFIFDPLVTQPLAAGATAAAEDSAAAAKRDRIFFNNLAKAEEYRFEVASEREEMEKIALEDLKRGWAEANRQEKEAIENHKNYVKALVDVAGGPLAPMSNARALDFEVPNLKLDMDYTKWRVEMQKIDFFPVDEMRQAVRDGVKDADADRAVGRGTGLLQAGMGGMSAVLATMVGGPWGALLATANTAARSFGGTEEEPGWMVRLIDEMMSVEQDFFREFESFLDQLPERIAKIPGMVEAISTLPLKIAMSLIEHSPELLASLIEVMIELPFIVIKGFAEALSNLPEDFAIAFAKAMEGLGGRVGDTLGIHMGAQAKASGDRELFGIHIPKFDRFSESPGMITRTGLAVVHRGEEIGPPRRGAVSIGQIHVHGVQDAQRFVEQLRAKLGTRGLGLSLEPYGGVG